MVNFYSNLSQSFKKGMQDASKDTFIELCELVLKIIKLKLAAAVCRCSSRLMFLYISQFSQKHQCWSLRLSDLQLH